MTESTFLTFVIKIGKWLKTWENLMKKLLFVLTH